MNEDQLNHFESITFDDVLIVPYFWIYAPKPISIVQV